MTDNCVNRYAPNPLDVNSLEHEITKYNKEDGTFFRQFALEHLNVDCQVHRYIQLYEQFLSQEKEKPFYQRAMRYMRKKKQQFYVWQKYFFSFGKSRY